MIELGIVLLSALPYAILAQENPGKDPMQNYFFRLSLSCAIKMRFS
jgi:hypothetical protein